MHKGSSVMVSFTHFLFMLEHNEYLTAESRVVTLYIHEFKKKGKGVQLHDKEVLWVTGGIALTLS
jgi:hypothetical protein